MHVSTKEFEAIHAAIDFIVDEADGADDDKYPHDIIDGLRSLLKKSRKYREQKHFKYLVRRELKKLQNNNSK